MRTCLRSLSATGALLTVATLAASCSDAAPGPTSTPPPSGHALSVMSQVPAAIKGKGTLTVAIQTAYPPGEFLSHGRLAGVDPDLARAIGRVMRLKVSMTPLTGTYAAILPAVAAHKYDLGMAFITDTRAREKALDFVDYFLAGTSFYVKTQGGPDVTSLADLCGRKVAAVTDSIQQQAALAQAAACKSGHRPTLTFNAYSNQNAVNSALSSGHATVAMADTPVAIYQVEHSGGVFKVSGAPYGVAPCGIAVPKDSGMARPVQAALEKLMADGAYRKILRRWGQQSGALSDPVINGATR